jgi:TRAP-type C4-dicarboxylate transport system substrate-binding protein
MNQVSSIFARVIAAADACVRAPCWSGVAVLVLLPSLAAAEPVQLKLATFLSERTESYEAGVKPFVDAVNAEGKGIVTITVYPDGTLGKAVAEQPALVLDGVADLAWVVPGQTPYRFPDNQLLELPGLFHDLREGTLAYTRLIAANALSGYQDFLVIGTFTSGPTFIHSRRPIETLAALKGQRIRSNNQIEAEALERLGAAPAVLPASHVAGAVARGAVDGAALAPAALFDFGVASVTKHHYLLAGGVAPLVLAMNRKKFDSLPDAAKAVIRKYSGEWMAASWIGAFGAGEREALAKIKADGARRVTEPSPADRAVAQQTYRSLIESWAAKSARNRELVNMIQAELATIRSGR